MTDVVEKPTEAMIQQELASRILCRRRLLPFIMRFNQHYDPGWVHKDICSRLEKFSEQVALKQSPRLMLFMPPRSGKSEIVSRNFPAWHLGRNPTHEFIATSYSSSLALKFSKKVRGVLREPGYSEIFPQTGLDPTTQAAEAWATTSGGNYMAAGVSGPLTGNGMHCVPLWVKVPSSKGLKTLEWLINNRHEAVSVLSYDGQTIKEGKVNGYVTRLSDHYYKLRTSDGQSLDVTGEHPVCVGFNEAGPVYRRVDDLRIGDSIVVVTGASALQDAALGSVPAVPGDVHSGDGQVSPHTSGGAHLLEQMRGELSEPRGEYTSQLRDVRDAEEGVELVTGSQECIGADGVLLQQRVLWDSPVEDVYRGESSSIQLGAGGVCALWHPTPMHNGGFATLDEALLQPEMLSRVVSRHDYSPGAAAFGTILSAGVQTCPEADDTRQGDVCSVRGGPGAGVTPPGRGSGEQLPGESSANLFQMPREASPQHGYTRVESLERVDETLVVGDISVADYHNFLTADKILLRNCGIIDDPVKNREEADSETTRESIKEWYTSTFYTRLAPGAGILIVLTRWHHDDLAGWLLEEAKNGGDKWEVVVYPAIAEQDEEFRLKGEALHPARYDIPALERIQRAVGPRDWQALYQQQPTADTGAFFKKDWFRYYLPEERPALSELTCYTAWDLAIGKKADNDRTVGLTVGVDKQDRIWLLDLVYGRYDALEMVDLILDTWETWRSKLVGLERGHIFMTLGPLLEKRIRERKLWSFPYDPEGLKTGNRDKESRAAAIQGRTRQGMCMFPRNAPWLGAFESELLSFPSGAHDDMVDAYAWIGLMINMFFAPVHPVERKKTWKDKLNQYITNTTTANPMAS